MYRRYAMVYFIIEEWVALMPAEMVKMVVENIKDDKIYHLYLKAVKENILSGYRPDLVSHFPEIQVRHCNKFQ